MPAQGAATLVCASRRSCWAICLARIAFCRLAASMLPAVARRLSAICSRCWRSWISVRFTFSSEANKSSPETRPLWRSFWLRSWRALADSRSSSSNSMLLASALCFWSSSTFSRATRFSCCASCSCKASRARRTSRSSSSSSSWPACTCWPGFAWTLATRLAAGLATTSSCTGITMPEAFTVLATSPLRTVETMMSAAATLGRSRRLMPQQAATMAASSRMPRAMRMRRRRRMKSGARAWSMVKVCLVLSSLLQGPCQPGLPRTHRAVAAPADRLRTLVSGSGQLLILAHSRGNSHNRLLTCSRRLRTRCAACAEPSQ